MPSITVLPWELAAGVPSTFFDSICPVDPAAARADDDRAPHVENRGECNITREYLGPDVWIECDERTGVAQIHDPRLFRPELVAFCRAVAHEAIERFGAARVEICLRSSLCRLEFGPGAPDRNQMAHRLAATVRGATRVFGSQDSSLRHSGRLWFRLTGSTAGARMQLQQTQDDCSEQIVFIQAHASAFDVAEVRNEDGASLVNLALAGGSLVMAAAGAVLPGMPALPFLILAANRAARVSPELDRWLRYYPWCHSLVSRMAGPENLLPGDWRSLLKMLLITAVAGTAFALVHPPLPVVIAIEIGVLALVCLKEANLLSSMEHSCSAAA